MKRRIKLSFILLAGLLILSGIICYFELARLNNSTQQVVDFGARSVTLSNNMLNDIAALDNAIVKYVSGNDSSYLSSQTRQLSEALDKTLSDIKAEYPQDAHLNTLIKAHSDYRDIVIHMDSVQMDTAWYFNVYKTQYAELENGVKNFLTSTQNLVVNEVNSLKNNAYRAIMYGIVTIATAVVVICLMFFFINVFYINPIIDISKALKNYLAMRVPFDIDVAAKDEVFMLKEYIEQLILRIKSKKS